jgi:hypothetical protein
MAVIMVFNLWIGPGFVFEFMYFTINISIAIFLLLPLDWICCQVHILTGLQFLWCLATEIVSSKGSIRLDNFLPEDGNEAGF